MLILSLCLSIVLTPGHVQRTIDGDTFVLYHVGVPAREGVRVLEIDTPERGQPGFFEARDFTIGWLASGDFTMRACKRDSFGRYLAVVTRNDTSLADALFAAGHGARP